MKKNGFAISGILYPMLILFLCFVLLILASLAEAKFQYDTVKKEIVMGINDSGYEEFKRQLDLAFKKMNELYQVSGTPYDFVFPLSTGNELGVYGQASAWQGEMKIEGGKSELAVFYNHMCATKRKGESMITIVDDIPMHACNLRSLSNLIKNGYLEYQDNTNFSTYTYSEEGLKVTDSKRVISYSDEYIPIDINKTYRMKITVKSTPEAYYYLGVASYDIDKKPILPQNFQYIQNTLTTLKQDLKPGDTKVYLDNITNFITSDLSYQNGLSFWNYQDSTGYQYPSETYTRNAYWDLYKSSSIDRTNHVITLKNAWSRPTMKAGTSVSQSHDGATYTYCLRAGTIGSEWTTYECQIKGLIEDGKGDSAKFRSGTKYIRVYGTLNYHSVPDVTMVIKDIVLEEVEEPVREQNLVTNGYLEKQDNTNFSNFQYRDGALMFHSNSAIYLGTDELIPVDPSKTYFMSTDAKSTNPNTNHYIGFREYDIDQKVISPQYVMYIPNTKTTLKQDLKPGDMKVYLDNITNFITSDRSHQNGLIFWNYQDSTGYMYPAETYSRNTYLDLFDSSKLDRVNHTITLKTPWTGPTIKAGTSVSQSDSGSVFNYCMLPDKPLTNHFQTFTCTMTGTGKNNEITHFRAGTKYIQWQTIFNHQSLADVSTYYRNIIIREQ